MTNINTTAAAIRIADKIDNANDLTTLLAEVDAWTAAGGSVGYNGYMMTFSGNVPATIFELTAFELGMELGQLGTGKMPAWGAQLIADPAACVRDALDIIQRADRMSA